MFDDVYNVLLRELKRFAKEPVAFFVSFFGPLLAFFLILQIFKSGVPRDLPVAVVDLDHTTLSAKVARFTDASSIAKINRSYISLVEAREALEAGKVKAVLYIPEGTEKNIYRGEQITLALYLNNANVITGSLLNSGIQKALQTLSGGIKLQSRLRTGETEKEAMARIMPVKLTSEILFNPYMNYAYFITFILLPIMFTVFVFFGTLYTIGTELQYGTSLQWVQTGGGSIVNALVGKLFPYTLLFLVVAGCMNLSLFSILGAPIRGDVWMLLLSEIIFILAYQSMAIIFITLTSNLRLALSLGSAFTMLAVTFAGFSFPVYAMPATAKFLSSFFPLSFWIDSFVGQSIRQEPVAITLHRLLLMMVFIVVGFFFIPRLKYISMNKEYWGKI
jgi:ABC-2 type transport system permease protein